MPKYIQNRNDLKRFLKTELPAYGSGWKRWIPVDIAESQVLQKYTYLLRCTEYHLNMNHKLRYRLFRLRLLRMQTKYSIHIPVNVFDEGLRIMHLGPILVNHHAVVGKNCYLHLFTSIVAGGLTSDAPVLGDNIVVGIGATVLGKVCLANGIAIGAHSVVNKSFSEENIAIAGVPARKISTNGTIMWNQD